MNGSNSRKIKLLKIWEILNRDTDENNPMPTPVLIKKLAECGIEVDRKILYSDIKLLNDFGYEVNRSIGGDAPSIYTKNIMKKVDINETELKTRIETNLVNYDLLVSDNFDEYFIDRAKKILVLIDNAMGKQVADRGSENVIQKYGQSLQ